MRWCLLIKVCMINRNQMIDVCCCHAFFKLQADLPESHLQSLEQLQHSVTNHKVAKHDTLEALARGLLKHITDQRLDEEQLPSMLKFVVKQAAVQTQQKAHTVDSSDGAASSSLGLYSGASSSKGAYNRIPAGESSLTDTELLMVLEQMAASSADQEQIALYQVSQPGRHTALQACMCAEGCGTSLTHQ